MLTPFHWEIEFPEVFQRENSGFDSIVGNPPFQGGRNLSSAQGEVYSQWLNVLHQGSNRAADLVAHFFRKSFDLLRAHGTLGLIATNSVAQGDTRVSGLRWICNQDGKIYNAVRRCKWPGIATVIVSIIHISKRANPAHIYLDSMKVGKVSAFLFHSGGNDDPSSILANKYKCFQGSIALGMGFTFDDSSDGYITNSLAKMQAIIQENPRSIEVVFPYIGGKEVNTHPTHSCHRFIIDLGEMSKEECNRNWPEIMTVLDTKVKPDRITKDPQKYPRMVNEWWKLWNPRTELYSAITGLDRVIVLSRVTSNLALAFIPSQMVFADSLYVFPLNSFSAFCALQARAHEIWARFFGSSLEDRLRYTPSDCFETFPFPRDWETHPSLEAVGKTYYEFRAELMVSNNEGLTKTYNRFHDPLEDDSRILRLRELHTDMDRAVLDAYGWTDIPTECEFLLDYEIDEEEWGKKKKPWRYRWPDHVRDEVLGRLLELNAQRAAEEQRSGAAAKKPSQRPKRSPRRASDKSPSLFP